MSLLNQTKNTKDTLAFLRLNEDRMIDVYCTSVKQHCKGNFFARMDEHSLRTFAEVNLTGIINRFDGIAISLERTEQNLFGFFDQGATLKDFVQLLDTTVEAIMAEIKILLADQPELCEFVCQKMNYIRQAYGSTVALSMSKYQIQLPKRS